jgi:hypothetical protein
MPGRSQLLGEMNTTPSGQTRWLIGPRPGLRRVCGFRLTQELSFSRTHSLRWSPLFLNPHLALVQEIQPGHCHPLRLPEPTLP